jgi:hypothetical protein
VILPELIALSRKIHRDLPSMIAPAVLCAWAGLAGYRDWTPAMVDTVEREVKCSST